MTASINSPQGPASAPIQILRDLRLNDVMLRAEAAVEPDAPATGPVTKTTQIIAIYGKGGIGKSFTRPPAR